MFKLVTLIAEYCSLTVQLAFALMTNRVLKLMLKMKGIDWHGVE